MKSFNQFIQESILQSKIKTSSSLEDLTKHIDDPDEDVKIAIIKHPNVSEHILNHISKQNITHDTKVTLYNNPKFKNIHLMNNDICHKSMYIRHAIANNPNITNDMRNLLKMDKNQFVKDRAKNE